MFVIAWWMVFFAALPIGVRSQNETDEDIVEGTVPSAPSNPNLKKKAFYTTLVAIVLTVAYYYVADSGIITFRGKI